MFSLPTLMVIGQQATLAYTLEILTIKICLFETLIQDSIIVVRLNCPQDMPSPCAFPEMLPLFHLAIQVWKLLFVPELSVLDATESWSIASFARFRLEDSFALLAKA